MPRPRCGSHQSKSSRADPPATAASLRRRRTVRRPRRPRSSTSCGSLEAIRAADGRQRKFRHGVAPPPATCNPGNERRLCADRFVCAAETFVTSSAHQMELQRPVIGKRLEQDPVHDGEDDGRKGGVLRAEHAGRPSWNTTADRRSVRNAGQRRIRHVPQMIARPGSSPARPRGLQCEAVRPLVAVAQPAATRNLPSELTILLAMCPRTSCRSHAQRLHPPRRGVLALLLLRLSRCA